MSGSCQLRVPIVSARDPATERTIILTTRRERSMPVATLDRWHSVSMTMASSPVPTFQECLNNRNGERAAIHLRGNSRWDTSDCSPVGRIEVTDGDKRAVARRPPGRDRRPAGSAGSASSAIGIVDTARRCGRGYQMLDEGRPAFGSAVCPATPTTSAANGRRRGRPSQTPAASTTPVPGSRRLADLRCAGRRLAGRGLPGGQVFWF